MMPKKLFDKFDMKEVVSNMQGMVNQVKSVLSPGGQTPEPAADDQLGLQIAELSTIAQQIAEMQQQQSEELLRMNEKLNRLYKNLETVRQSQPAHDEGSE